jgi:drug/metabolite transporter (DMT)-like permease
VTELLALGSAAAFGVGDFMGGLASRRGRPIRVTALQQIASVVLLLPLVVAIPAPIVATRDLIWGAAGGVFGMVGILALFSGLSRGPMGVVAPVTAVLAAVVPLGVGVASGERPSAMALVGMAIGLAAIAAVSATGTGSARIDRYALLSAVVAGLSFGLFFVFIGRTSVDAGMWPLVTARAVSVPLIAVLAAMRGGVLPARPARPLAVASGVVDMAANGLFLAAAQRGLLSIASLLSALYPVGTVVLAWIVLGERLGPVQVAGVGLAVGAVALIGLGG